MELPPGFRFQPTDEELITHYLSRKASDAAFHAVAIGEIDLYKCEPWDLPQRATMGEKEWYFFCVRDRKYPTGLRTNRATKAGYWKATGKDSAIYRGRGLVGMKKTLVFYRGRAPKGEKSNWVMHEYRLEGKNAIYNLPPKMAKIEWVVCRVFHRLPAVRQPVNPSTDSRDSNCHSNVHEAADASESSYVTCFSNNASGLFVDQLDDDCYFLPVPAEPRRAPPPSPLHTDELICSAAPPASPARVLLLDHALWNC